jgi:hypothetical protein
MGRSVLRSFGPIGVAALLVSGIAHAEPSAAELAAARDMFKEARQAEDASDWAAALDKLKAVAEVKMTAQVRFHLGLCRERLGQLVEALNDFERATSEAAEQRIASVAAEAPEHATAIRERLPKLTFEIPRGAGDAKVTIDGSAIAASMLSRAIPTNPGNHDIVVSAPGKIYRERISLAEKEPRAIKVVFSPDASTTVAPAPTPTAPPTATTPLPNRAEKASGGGSTAGFIMIGTGSALVVGSVVSVLVRSRALSSIDDKCPTHQMCSSDVRDDQSRAKTFGALAVAFGAAGVASVATGVVLVATSKKSSVAIAPFVTGRETGLAGAVRW